MRQLVMCFEKRGGKRKGAGRKSYRETPCRRHVEREKMSRGTPLHITLRMIGGLPSLRRVDSMFVVCQAFTAARDRLGMRIVHYGVMTNHIHLIGTPSLPSSLPDMMQSVGRDYVPIFNRRYERTGSLWEGRYKASLIHDEKYWLTCLRYVELNPVRAGLVESPELYEWSSYRAHAFGRPDPLLTPHHLYLEFGQTSSRRQEAWQAICRAPIDEHALITIRYCVQTGRALRDGLDRAPTAGPAPELPARV